MDGHDKRGGGGGEGTMHACASKIRDIAFRPPPGGGGSLVSALPRFTEMKSFLDRGGHPLNIAPGGGGSFSGGAGR